MAYIFIPFWVAQRAMNDSYEKLPLRVIASDSPSGEQAIPSPERVIASEAKQSRRPSSMFIAFWAAQRAVMALTPRFPAA